QRAALFVKLLEQLHEPLTLFDGQPLAFSQTEVFAQRQEVDAVARHGMIDVRNQIQQAEHLARRVDQDDEVEADTRSAASSLTLLEELDDVVLHELEGARLFCHV